MNSVRRNDNGLVFTIDDTEHYLPRDAFDYDLKVQRHPCTDVLVEFGDSFLREKDEPEPDLWPKGDNIATGKVYPSSTGQALVVKVYDRPGYLWAYLPWVQQVYTGERESVRLLSILKESELPDFVNAAMEVRA